MSEKMTDETQPNFNDWLPVGAEYIAPGEYKIVDKDGHSLFFIEGNAFAHWVADVLNKQIRRRPAYVPPQDFCGNCTGNFPCHCHKPEPMCGGCTQVKERCFCNEQASTEGRESQSGDFLTQSECEELESLLKRIDDLTEAEELRLEALAAKSNNLPGINGLNEVLCGETIEEAKS